MSTTIVKSHWHHSIANFQTSTQEFYAALEQAVQPHQIPGLSVTRFEWKEGGAFSAKREYLRIRREKMIFDVCAAPFGADYFFSWWLAEDPPKFGLLKLAGITFGLLIIFGLLMKIVDALFGGIAGAVLAVPIAIIAFPAILWGLGNAVHNGNFGPDAEEGLIDTPILGWLYVKLIGPFTYYKIDTMQVFQSAIQSSVNEAVEAVLSAKGMKALTEDERKPAMNNFFKR